MKNAKSNCAEKEVVEKEVRLLSHSGSHVISILSTLRSRVELGDLIFHSFLDFELSVNFPRRLAHVCVGSPENFRSTLRRLSS